MAWIESHTVLIRHRKVSNLARDLRIRPSYAMGHLHALWHAALEQREDGDLSDWSDEFIAQSSDFPGDAPQYVRLLQQHRWLDGKIIHDWVDYAGLYLTRKYSTGNKDLLTEIWLKHGRVYGVNGKRTNSERIANIPLEVGKVGTVGPPRGSPEGERNVALLLKAEIGKAFGRKPEDSWTYDEEHALAEVCRRKQVEAEWLEIMRYRHGMAEPKWFPRSVGSVLNKWNSLLDTARLTPAAAQTDLMEKDLRKLERL